MERKHEKSLEDTRRGRKQHVLVSLLGTRERGDLLPKGRRAQLIPLSILCIIACFCPVISPSSALPLRQPVHNPRSQPVATESVLAPVIATRSPLLSDGKPPQRETGDPPPAHRKERRTCPRSPVSKPTYKCTPRLSATTSSKSSTSVSRSVGVCSSSPPFRS